MSKTKIRTAASKISSGKTEGISTIQAMRKSSPATGLRILYQGTCPKLTTRGRGDLSYELGIDDETGDSYIRISGNASSGAFSHEWLALNPIRSMIASKEKMFSAAFMHDLFTRRSSNNSGYLAAILKAEGVLHVLPGKPVMLKQGEWGSILEKINVLREKGVRLTDHIAIAAQQKAEKRSKLMSNPGSTKSTKSTSEAGDKEGLNESEGGTSHGENDPDSTKATKATGEPKNKEGGE